MGTHFLSIAAHLLKLIVHRKKMTRQFLPMASPFVAMRPSYQNWAGQFYPARLPLLLVPSRNISGPHKKTCENAANAKRVQTASPNPFLFHPVYQSAMLKRSHRPNAAGAGVGAEAAGYALAVIGDIAVGHAVRSLLSRQFLA